MIASPRVSQKSGRRAASRGRPAIQCLWRARVQPPVDAAPCNSMGPSRVPRPWHLIVTSLKSHINGPHDPRWPASLWRMPSCRWRIWRRRWGPQRMGVSVAAWCVWGVYGVYGGTLPVWEGPGSGVRSLGVRPFMEPGSSGAPRQPDSAAPQRCSRPRGRASLRAVEANPRPRPLLSACPGAPAAGPGDRQRPPPELAGYQQVEEH
jgi:hypothetical protein